MTGFRHPAFSCALILSLLLAVPSSLFPGAVDAQGATPVASDSGEGAVLLFSAPGMRPDLVETFAAEGALPAMAGMLADGRSCRRRHARALSGHDWYQPGDIADRYLAGRARSCGRPLFPHRFT